MKFCNRSLFDRLSFRALSAAALLLLVSGCAVQLPVAPVRPFESRSETFDYPKLGVTTTGELGQTLIDKGVMHHALVCDLKEEVEFRLNAAQMETLPPQTLIAHAQDEQWIYYHAQSIRHKNVGDFGAVRSEEGKLVRVGLRIAKDQSRVEAYFWWLQLTYVPILPPKFEIRKVQTSIYPSFRQQLIYNGRVGNSLKFLYREISNDLMRPAFSQDVQYDISASKTIGFKGARMEVIDATNESITYKLLSAFRDQAN